MNKNILNELYKSIKYNDIHGLIKVLQKIIEYKDNKNKYLNEILYPEIYKYTKMPSLISLPSCSFQLYFTETFTVNDNLYFMFSPFFLYNSKFMINTDGSDNQLFYGPNGDSTTKKHIIDNPHEKDWRKYYSPEYLTSFFYQDNGDTGVTDNPWWYTVNINQGVGDLYKKYRLVSACMIVKYIGKQADAQGTIHGGIIYDDNPYVGIRCDYVTYDRNDPDTIRILGDNTANKGMFKYGGKPNALYNAFYHKENLMNEPMKLIYFPMDNSYEQFVNVCGLDDFKFSLSPIEYDGYTFDSCNLELKNNNNRTFFKFLVYITNAQYYEDAIKVEIFCNYEGIPNYEYLNYIPTNTNTYNINNKDKKEIIKKLQKKPIVSIDDKDAAPINSYNWEKDLKKIYTNN
jgi:hypothetical protein